MANVFEGGVLFDGAANLVERTEMKERRVKGLQDKNEYNKRCFQTGR